MNLHNWLNEWTNAAEKKSMPILSFPSVQLLGINVRELIGSADRQAEGMKAVADRIPSAAAVSMMDLSVEAEAFGAEIIISDDDVPTCHGALVTDEDEADALEVPAVGTARTGRYIEAIGKAKQLITDRPVFAGVIGPFSLAGRLMDVTEALINCYTEPDMVHTVMKKATAFLIEYIKGYRDVGADGIVIAEPLTGLLSPDLAEEFSEPYVRELIEAVKTDDFLVIYHNCGDNVVKMIDSILRVGADAYHFGNSISMLEMLEKVPADTIVMGNIDPVSQFKNGTPESMRQAVLDLMSECNEKYPNFIISSGCDIPPAANWDNIDAYFKAIDEFYQNK